MKLKEILIIDDDNLILETLKDALEMEGYPVVTALNGAEAVNYLKQCNPEDLPALILLDLRIPVINGVEFLKIKAKTPKFQHIPVVVTSAIPTIAKKEIMRFTVDNMQKPWNLDELYMKVELYHKQSHQLLAG